MGSASKAADLAFKGFTAGLGVATIYLGYTFSINLTRCVSWHTGQTKINKEGTAE